MLYPSRGLKHKCACLQAQVKGTPAQQSRGADKGSETANEQPEVNYRILVADMAETQQSVSPASTFYSALYLQEKEIPTLPQTTVEDNPSAK